MKILDLTVGFLALAIVTPANAATVLFGQGNIPIIYENVFGSQYKGVNAGQDGHCGQPMWFPYSGSPVYPFPRFIPDSTFEPMTFYHGDGDTNAIGAKGNLIYQLTGLQGGITIGMSLAPRALTAAPMDLAILANYWFCSFPRPWFGHNGIQIAAQMTLPFVYVPGSGLIGQKGTVFAYFVVQISNVNDPSQTIYIAPRILQNQYPQGADQSSDYEHQFGPGNQIWKDDSGNPILFPELRSGAWITSCGAGQFSLGPVSVPKIYCFDMNASQLSTAITAINAASWIPRHNYDTTAANWQVRLINIDAEAWAPGGSDPRLGFSFSQWVLWQL